MNSAIGGTSEPYRPLGLLAMAGGVAYFVAGIVMGRTGNEEHFAVSLLSLAWALGSVCGLVGIGLLGVAGRGSFGRVALALAVVAYAVRRLMRC